MKKTIIFILDCLMIIILFLFISLNKDYLVPYNNVKIEKSEILAITSLKTK